MRARILLSASLCLLLLAVSPSAAADAACVGKWAYDSCTGVGAGNFPDPTPASDPICSGVFVLDTCVGVSEAETGTWTCLGAYVDYVACAGLVFTSDGRTCVVDPAVICR